MHQEVRETQENLKEVFTLFSFNHYLNTLYIKCLCDILKIFIVGAIVLFGVNATVHISWKILAADGVIVVFLNS